MLPTIPKPLHGVNPRTVLGSKWWDETRRAAYRSTEQHCITCGVHKYSAPRCLLDGHELYETDYLAGRLYYIETVPLCKTCHSYIHSGRLLMLFEEGKITKEEYDVTIAYGELVLKQARITIPPPSNEEFADWEDWRLVVNGKEYPPKNPKPT